VARILVAGKTGQLGWELQTALPALGDVITLDRAQMDLTSADSIRAALRQHRPDIIVNAAGYTIVDKAESEPELVWHVNAVAPGVIAEEAKRLDALLLHYSTDYVYDGTKGATYTEDDAPNPLNTYGKSKLAGEQAVAAAGCAHLILRASWIYSDRGNNFVLMALRLAREREQVAMVADQVGSPCWARTLARATADLLEKVKAQRDITGVYHFSAANHTTRYDFATHIIARARGRLPQQVRWATLTRTTTANYPLPAARPLNVATSKDKLRRDFGITMPTWEEQIDAYIPTCIALWM
jgi:dTDP-4-dehydrorhamnose reductase